MNQHPFSSSLIVGISSRALFNLDESHHIYENEGVETYANYQMAHENKILEPGHAFSLVKKLLALVSPQTQEFLVEVVLLSRNSADTGLRIFNSIKAHELRITRAAFTQGQSPYAYARAFGANLFLSANVKDVQAALTSGIAAATIFPSTPIENNHLPLKMAFDGDSVLFSDEAEQIFKRSGLEEFTHNEILYAKKPLQGGPFKDFLAALHHLQKQFSPETCPIRTALVTARSAPTHERVIHTLRAWGIRIDEALFLGGLSKGAFLKAFNADFYFDDQPTHCETASQHVATAHVPQREQEDK